MITLRLGQHHLETHEAAALIEAIGRQEKSCDTVWFSTLYGYPPLLVQQEAADKMAAAAALFRQAAIGVSMQVSNTLGHGEYVKSEDCSGLVYDGSPAEHMVGANGEAAGYCFCWRGEHFRRYLEDSLALYAQVKPDVVWFDDDLRADNHYPVEYGCYCDHCISGFNAIYGTSFSRASLVREINYGNPIWRQRFIDSENRTLPPNPAAYSTSAFCAAGEIVTDAPEAEYVLPPTVTLTFSGSCTAEPVTLPVL